MLAYHRTCKTSFMVAPAIAQFESCEKIDDYTFILHQNAPNPITIELLASAQMAMTNKKTV